MQRLCVPETETAGAELNQVDPETWDICAKAKSLVRMDTDGMTSEHVKSCTDAEVENTGVINIFPQCRI